jgi:NAD(P)-dependent dehydrogenase (short-subunit alcohol dehydrogenase family)
MTDLGRLRASAPDVSGMPMAELLRLDGRGAVVTGGARGLGLAIAERLAEAGAGVLVADTDGTAAALAAAAIANAHAVPTDHVAVDVRDADALHAAAGHAAAAFGRLDVWVNNAGIFTPAHPVTASAEEFERIMSVNVTGMHLGCQAAAARMADSGGGVIVNMASTAGYRGAGAYSASKWAVRGMTSGLAARLGPQGIRVVAVAPSFVPGTPGAGAVLNGGGERMARRVEDLVTGLPLGRASLPDDIARAVLFLASDAACYITGVTLAVDGGELTA